MKKITRKYLLIITGLVIEAIAGFVCWNFIGYSNGSCYIQSNPLRMTLYGALMGGLVLNIFQPKTNQQQHGK